MNRLIDDQGRITLGIFPHPIKEINYRDYLLTTPMGSRYHPSSEIYGSTSFVFLASPGRMSSPAWPWSI
ncbi:MAG: hypothetical protein R2874_08995 [Desulfobacterales bacterium]